MDSSCNDHYDSINVDVEDARSSDENAVTTALLNVASMNSTHVEKWKYHKFLAKARVCHLFPDMKTKGLMCLGKLCNCGMKIILTKNKTTITNKDNESEVIMMGACSLSNGTWFLDVNNESNKKC